MTITMPTEDGSLDAVDASLTGSTRAIYSGGLSAKIEVVLLDRVVDPDVEHK
jgi:hypothetical protein